MQRAVCMADGYQGVTLEERDLLSQIFDKVVKETFGTAESPNELVARHGGSDDIVT